MKSNRRLSGLEVTVIGLALLLALTLVAVRNGKAVGAIGGGTPMLHGSGWGSPTNVQTVMIPPWIWEFIGGYLAGKFFDSIHDCGINTTCDPGSLTGGLGGGGGGGFGGDGPVNYPNNARAGSKPIWNFFVFKNEQH